MKKKIFIAERNLLSIAIFTITIISQLVAAPAMSANWHSTRYEIDSIPNRNRSQNPFLKRWVEPDFITGPIVIQPDKSPLEDWLLFDSKFTEQGSLNISNTGTPLLVFGDGLAAGWKDGGLSRDAQQFSFPNLVAHQLNIKDFNSPLFDVEHSNGTGFLVREQGSKNPRWKEVANNLAIKSSGEIPELIPYEGDDPENLAQPRISAGSVSATLSPLQDGWIFDDSGRRYTDDMPFLWRLDAMADKAKTTYWEMAQEKLKLTQPQLVFSVFGFDQMTEQNVKSENVKMSWGLASAESSPLSIAMAELGSKNGAKGVVFTIPDFKNLPYFNWYKKAVLDELNAKLQIRRSRIGIIGNALIRGKMIFLPTKNTELLFNEAAPAGTAEFPLEDKDVADESEIAGGSSAAINERIKHEAREKGLLVVDLAALFETIYASGFKTAEGYIVEPGENSSFFSEDGLYPSAIGHAIIANETIKVLNEALKSKIPLININEFAAYLK